LSSGGAAALEGRVAPGEAEWAEVAGRAVLALRAPQWREAKGAKGDKEKARGQAASAKGRSKS